MKCATGFRIHFLLPMMWYTMSAFSEFITIDHSNVLVRLIYPALASFLWNKFILEKKTSWKQKIWPVPISRHFPCKNQTPNKLKGKNTIKSTVHRIYTNKKWKAWSACFIWNFKNLCIPLIKIKVNYNQLGKPGSYYDKIIVL